MKLTIGVKALNEERHIAAALHSAIRAALPFGGEVILADSGSTDRTVEIARQLDVKILQLAKPSEKSCGAGAQLAFQEAAGEYFYLLDGDMVLDEGFLPAAIAFLRANPSYAGVGGRVVERHTEGHDFQIRANTVQYNASWLPGDVDRLDCGGLYRTSAVRESGYLADRNLHAFEELELGSRLMSRGWKLARIDHHAVDHYGHQVDGYRMLMRRLKSGYAGAPGEVLRAALGKSHLPIVLKTLGHLRVSALVMAWWLALAFTLVGPAELRFVAALALLAAPLVALCLRRRSFRLGLYSFVSWNVTALALLGGVMRGRIDPKQALAVRRFATRQPAPSQEAPVDPFSGASEVAVTSA